MYYVLQIDVPEEASELLQALLDATAPLGLELRDHSLKLPPGTPAPPPGKSTICAWYETQLEAEEALRQVRRELPEADGSCAPVQQENWAETWKKHVRSVRIGRLWVGPPWEKDAADDAPIRIVIEPGMAFGTGDHPTTEMCLAELDAALTRRPGSKVLDVGCGSGILAIAARMMGAGKVLGNDIDPVAVRVARENAESNGVTDIEFTERPVERIDGHYEIVLGNLFANVLCQLAPRLAARTAQDGLLIITGILAPQATEVVEAFERERMRVVTRRNSGEWVLFALEHR